MKAVTFNLRCSWDGDGKNSFIHRAGMIYDKLLKELPEVIAFQEMREGSLQLLKRMLPEYEFFGQMRSKNYDGEGLYTAVLKESCEILGGETFWLSPTPYIPGSRFDFQSPCPRICVVAKIRNKATGALFRVFNVHLDHISEKARLLGMDCVFKSMQEYAEREPLPTVLLGDFNAEPTEEVIRICNARKDIIDVTSHIPVTFHGFFDNKYPCGKIDYVFVSSEWGEKVEGAEAWTDEHDGVYLSDHYPICIRLKN